MSSVNLKILSDYFMYKAIIHIQIFTIEMLVIEHSYDAKIVAKSMRILPEFNIGPD